MLRYPRCGSYSIPCCPLYSYRLLGVVLTTNYRPKPAREYLVLLLLSECVSCYLRAYPRIAVWVSCDQILPLVGSLFAMPFFLLFFHLTYQVFIIFTLLFSFRRTTQIWGHLLVVGPSSPLRFHSRVQGSCLSFVSLEDFSPFFPRRLASNCAYPRYRRAVQ